MKNGAVTNTVRTFVVYLDVNEYDLCIIVNSDASVKTLFTFDFVFTKWLDGGKGAG